LDVRLWYASGQTDKHTDTLIAIFRTAIGGEVITAVNIHTQAKTEWRKILELLATARQTGMS